MLGRTLIRSSRVGHTSAIRSGVQSRGMAFRGWTRPNAQLDELAGRRETTYKYWDLDLSNVGRVGFGIGSVVVFGTMICMAWRDRRERMGRPLNN